MTKKTYITKNTKEMAKLAKLLGEELKLYKGERKHAFVIALKGDLGAGKTFFTTHVARGLGIKSKIQSPTFVLAKRYTITKSQFHNLWHMDLYRITKQSELTPIHFKDILVDPDSVVIIEWAERAKKLLPKDTVWVEFFHEAPTVRKVTFHS